MQLSEDHDTSDGDVADLTAECGVDRNENVDARPKPDDPHPVTLLHRLADFTVGHDPAGDEPRDLTNQNPAASSVDSDRHLLVLEARFLRCGVEELPLVVVNVSDDSVDRYRLTWTLNTLI